ncbi:MAG: 23S rRNA (adenine(2503)-C(2))-methyltransferase RlmN [Filifactor alocis]|nr:23S rRNA (adenine(2503)-C(2))-methyltransferase RlmN [Filifactor alocis]
MLDLRSLEYVEVEELVLGLGGKKYRAKQIYNYLARGCTSIDDMLQLPQDFREKLKEEAYVCKTDIYRKFESKVDSTRKYLIELEDGNLIETVLMIYKNGPSVCISTQVGCRMGCKFCASTVDGLIRNLTPGEILGQLITVQKDLGERIANIVIMGSGEPFDNYDNLIKFLKVVHEEQGMQLGYRHITVSTCGIVPKIKELQKWNIPINLAISLHQVEQEKREQIMPIARKYSVEEVVAAGKEYADLTKRRVTYEYALIEDVTDSLEEAHKLGKMLKGSLSMVNLIPINPIKENSFKKPNIFRIKAFQTVLLNYHVITTVRRELGADINGACGQLRRDVIRKEQR